MASRILEFRGINREHLGMYFEELGGVKVTSSRFENSCWSGEILSETELSFSPVFKVNSVHICFAANTEEILEELIKKYRYKTTRIGG